jgi:hypothetical protein
LSFAQFEREVIGERVRDKISASKRKGIWVGGPIPLGYASANKKIAVAPNDAETVRAIFRRYLELDSIGALMEDLDQRAIRTRRRRGADDRVSGGIRFGVGPLAHLLKNRFYVGEVAYRGEVHRGEHEPIVDRGLFDAVQAKLAANAVERRIRAKGSPAILSGRLFDDRGNRMSPTHSNKRGVRYRYYVSQPLVQKRQQDAGIVARVPAPEVENLLLGAIRGHLKGIGEAGDPITGTDRDLIERHVERITVKPQAVEVTLMENDGPATTGEHDSERVEHDGNDRPPLALVLPWAMQSFVAVKGIIHTPSAAPTLKPETRDALLMAIAKSRGWIDDLTEHRVASFAEIARREGKVERHIRLLAPLAFVSPKIVSAIIDGTVPADLTVTGLAKALPHFWAEQERRIGLLQA